MSTMQVLMESRVIIFTGIVTSAVAFGIYSLIKWLQRSADEESAEYDEYFENIENIVRQSLNQRNCHVAVSVMLGLA
jgi:translation elongation factor EF-1beta